MPRRPRICPAGTCFHIVNRAVARLTLLEKQEDYEAFERVLDEAYLRFPLPIFAYSVMPNHWHFAVRPKTETQVTNFFVGLCILMPCFVTLNATREYVALRVCRGLEVRQPQ